jgi:predicted transcriptional regulator
MGTRHEVYDMTNGDDSQTVFVCESCGNLGIGDGEITCCSRTMMPIETAIDEESVATEAISDPDLETLLRTVFGMSETELEICLCVMESGEITVQDLAETVDYDRSVVTRHLNHLADLEVIDKHRRLLESGGQLYVYTPVDPDEIRERFRQLFLLWVANAADTLEDLRREKVEMVVESNLEEPQWRIFAESQ